MALTSGILSQVAVGPTTANLQATAATGGTGPYTYQWYRALSSGFTPGGGNIISGATLLALADSGLYPLTQYYYKLVSTDTGNGNVTVTSAQLGVATTVQSPNISSFTETTYLGMTDLLPNINTVSVQIHSSQLTGLYAGCAVKMVDEAGGVPKVVGCTADSDQVLGFINFDIKTAVFLATFMAEISMEGNCMYLMATGAIARGAQVTLDTTSMGGVAQATGSSADRIVGWAYDKATQGGQLIRVFIKTPSFRLDS